VNSEAVDKAVKEIMLGEKAEETRSRANSFGDMARKAVEDGGSSYNIDLSALIKELKPDHA
jgi:hypothetical protein